MHAQYICKKDLQGCERTGFTAVSAGNCTIMAPKIWKRWLLHLHLCFPENLQPNVKSFALYMYNTIRAGCAFVHQNKPVCTAVSAGKPTVQWPVTDPPLVVRQSFGVVHSCSGGARVGFPELFQIEVSPWQRNQLTPIVWHSPGISQDCFGNEVAKLHWSEERE